MTYRVEFTARASRDLEILYKEKNAAESHAAARWFKGLEEAVYALASFPYRCPVPPEARKTKRKLRHLLYLIALTSLTKGRYPIKAPRGAVSI